MSDAMMFDIARMPYEMAMSDEMSRRQFYANTQRLVAALEAARKDAARGEDDAWCAECGVKLENVRPGKHQHPICSQAAPQQPAESAEPVAWVAADTLNSPHPTCVSSLAYMSQLDRERGREYVPLYAAPQQPAAVDEAAAILAFEEHFQASSDDPYFEGELELWLTAWRKALGAQQRG